MPTGTLPTGLSLNTSTGVISGTVSAAAVTETFTVKVVDSDGVSSNTQSLTITINGPPSVATTSLPGATKTGTYSQTLAATGGTSPYTWSMPSGTLPTGLTLNASTGVISGTVSATAVNETFTVKAVDSDGVSSNTQSLTITINGVPSVTTTSLPTATKGQSYSQTLAATGGTAPYTWSIPTGTLPNGLALNASTGVISGTVANNASTKTFTVEVTDSDGVTASQSLTITVT
jgi:hypothetical protein